MLHGVTVRGDRYINYPVLTTIHLIGYGVLIWDETGTTTPFLQYYFSDRITGSIWSKSWPCNKYCGTYFKILTFRTPTQETQSPFGYWRYSHRKQKKPRIAQIARITLKLRTIQIRYFHLTERSHRVDISGSIFSCLFVLFVWFVVPSFLFEKL